MTATCHLVSDDCPGCAGSGVVSRLGCSGREPYPPCRDCRGTGAVTVLLTEDQYRRYKNGESIE